MIRIPNWFWWLGSVTLFTAGIASLLVPAIRDARYAAMKSADK